jgi:hypothetical protein
MLKIDYPEQEIVAFGKLIYGRQDIGMGIAFTIVGPHDQKRREDRFAEQVAAHREYVIFLDSIK